MSAERAKAFTKSRACPSSEDISTRRLPRDKSEQIVPHVAGCEFWAAEQDFLSAFSHTTEEYKFAELPAHLRRLAEAMFVERLKYSSKGSKYGKESSFGRTGFRV